MVELVGGGGENYLNRGSVVELDVALVYDTLTPKCNRHIKSSVQRKIKKRGLEK